MKLGGRLNAGPPPGVEVVGVTSFRPRTFRPEDTSVMLLSFLLELLLLDVVLLKLLLLGDMPRIGTIPPTSPVLPLAAMAAAIDALVPLRVAVEVEEVFMTRPPPVGL